MNILDENVPENQRLLLRRRRIRVLQIGEDIGRKGMQDDEIIPLLHDLDRPTFFTLDVDFYQPRLRHEGYCLIHLAIARNSVAEFVRRVLRHPALNTKAKRMGLIVRVEPEGITLWRVRQERKIHLPWE